LLASVVDLLPWNRETEGYQGNEALKKEEDKEEERRYRKAAHSKLGKWCLDEAWTALGMW
jgi:hypothetical protein